MTSTTHLNRRRQYRGFCRKLVLSFDVGPEFSAISYSILVPGQGPEIRCITRFLGQEQNRPGDKVPTVIYYDKAGKVCAVGAEATMEGRREMAEEKGWIEADWFKLHLHPRSKFSDVGEPVPAPGKTLVRVLADFLQYLHKCAEAYIEDTHGQDLWGSMTSQVHYVLTHPSGWGSDQQCQFRDAIVLAELIPNTTDGHMRVSFVGHNEACLQFSIDNGLPKMRPGPIDGVVIVCAGSKTIDVSAYSKKMPDNTSTIGGTFEEMGIHQSHLFGSDYVTVFARFFIEDCLRDSEFLQDLKHIVNHFETETLPIFGSDKQPQYIMFGGHKDNDAAHNIRCGRLELAGTDVAAFFERSVKCIIESVLVHNKGWRQQIKYVSLHGVLSAVPWVVDSVRRALKPEKIEVFDPDFGRQPISDGAISFYLSQTQILKSTCGCIRSAELRAMEREREFLRMKENMNLEMKALRGELDIKRKECSDARDAELRAKEKEEQISRMKESMDLDMKALRGELDIKRKECSDARDAELRAREKEEQISRMKDLELKAVREDLDVKRKECLNADLGAREREREISRMKERVYLEMKAVKEELDAKRLECSDMRSALEEARKERREVDDAFQKSKDEAQILVAENIELSDKLSRLNTLGSIALHGNDSQHIEGRASSVLPGCSPNLSPPIPQSGGVIHLPEAEDGISVEEVMELVQELNLKIVETASGLVNNLALVAPGDPSDDISLKLSSTAPLSAAQTQEGSWLLGGEELTSLMGSNTTNSTKDSNPRLRMLLQIGLTTWSAYHVHSWELGWIGSSSTGLTEGPSVSPLPSSFVSGSDSSSPFAVIYKRLKTVEEPTVTTKWRSVTRSQIKFSSSAWTQALISSLSNLLSFLGLAYTRPTTLAQELQSLLSAIRSVREALGESIVSKELEVVTVTPGGRFDPRCMKDASTTGSSAFTRSSMGRPKREIVVATCGLGLKEVSLEDFGSKSLLVLPHVLRERSFCDL